MPHFFHWDPLLEAIFPSYREYTYHTTPVPPLPYTVSQLCEVLKTQKYVHNCPRTCTTFHSKMIADVGARCKFFFTNNIHKACTQLKKTIPNSNKTMVHCMKFKVNSTTICQRYSIEHHTDVASEANFAIFNQGTITFFAIFSKLISRRRH